MQVGDQHVPVVDLHKLTDFEWSDLFLFGPYQGREEICATLNLRDRSCTDVAPISVDEG